MLISPQEHLQHITLVPGQAHADAMIAEQFRSRAGTGPMQSPPVFALSQWVSEQCRNADLCQGRAAAMTAEPMDIKCLWEAIITDHVPGIAPEECYALAAQAASADRMLEQWNCGSGASRGDFAGSQFESWRRQFKAELQRRNWFRTSDWMRHFIEQLDRDIVPAGILPGTITLSGFVELTWLENALLAALAARGIKVNVVTSPPFNPPSCVKTGYLDIDREISAAAQWAKQKLEAGCEHMAIIINDLENLAGDVREILENVFDAPGVLALRAGENGVFAMPSGASLATLPVISDALLLLRLALGGRHQQHEFQDISRLLLSPCWHGTAQERFARARLEVRIRDLNYSKCSLALLADLAGRSPDKEGLRHLRNCLNAVLESPGCQRPTDQLVHWLQAWGWPGPHSPTPASLAAHGSLLQMLEQLSRQVSGNTRIACRNLTRLCTEARLPGTGGAFSPLQVLSPEQAYGRQFEAAWVLNLTLENWPPRPVNNALLPAPAVRRIPRASEQGMLAYTRRLTDWLVACAPEVRLSWCDRMNDLPVSASPLIAGFPLLDGGVQDATGLWAGACPAAGRIEDYAGHPWLREAPPGQGQPLALSANPVLHSAVRLLNLQSACPLAAYLVFRLDARMPAVPGPFADASYRGQLIHAALLRLYQPHAGRRTAPGALEITAAVEHALDSEHADRNLLPALYAAEKLLLEGMLHDWLDHEQGLQIADVSELEWQAELPLAGFTVQVRVDRVDRLADGRSILIDYKTGTGSSSSGWGADRLQDVQLPLYAVLLRDHPLMPPAAVLFANVGLHEAGTEGIADDPAAGQYGVAGYADKPKALARQLGSWPRTLDFWQENLHALVQEYVSGDSRNQVFNDKQLRFAGLDGILRTAEATRWVQERTTNGGV